MADIKRERVDLNNLSERELLIVVAKNQERIEDQCESMDERIRSMSIKVNTLETKGKTWGAWISGAFGLAGAAAIEIFARLFNK